MNPRTLCERPWRLEQGVENLGSLGPSLCPSAPLSPARAMSLMAARRERAGDPARNRAPLPHCPASRAARPRLGPVFKVPLGKEPPMHGIPRKGERHAPWEAPQPGKNPSGPSRPPYLTGAASSGRHHGAAGPVRLLRRRHLPAPGPRPRRQPRPVPDGASAIARDFTFRPTRRPPYPASALQSRLSGELLPAIKAPKQPPYFLLLLPRLFLPSEHATCSELPGLSWPIYALPTGSTPSARSSKPASSSYMSLRGCPVRFTSPILRALSVPCFLSFPGHRNTSKRFARATPLQH